MLESPETSPLERHARPALLDPRTKLFVLLVTSVALVSYGDAGGFSWSRASFALLAAVLLISSGMFGPLAVFVGLYTFAAAADALVLPGASGAAGMLLAAVTGMALRLLPGLAIAAYVLRTTAVSEFIAAMQQARAPKALTIPAAVMLRFFPTIAQEYAQISAAMRLRGLSVRGWRQPLRALQWRFVPLLAGVTRIGDELTASALCRGLEAPNARTSLRRVRLGPVDLAIAGTTLALAIWHLAGMWR